MKVIIQHIIVLMLCVQFSYASSNQKPPLVQLSRADSRQFLTALKSLSDQAHIAFICEGQPRHLKLSDKEAEKSEVVRLESPMPIDEAVKLLAAAYDYDVNAAKTARSSSYYLLTKKYSDPQELPYVTFDEVQHSLDGIALATSRFSTPYGNSYALRKIWLSLSEEQRNDFAKGVKIGQLPQDLQESVLQFASGLEYEGREALVYVSRRLKGCGHPETVFKWQTLRGLRYPIYEGPFGPNGGIWFVVLNRWINTQWGGATVLDGLPEIQYQDNTHRRGGIGWGNIVNGDKEPTVPHLTAKPSDAPPALTQPLSLIIAEVNKRLSREEGTITIAEADTKIAEKPILLVGDKYISPVDMVKACGDVYGLPVRTSTERRTVRILLPTAHVLNDVSQISSEIDRLLPAPFVKAVFNQSAKLNSEEQPMRWEALYIAAIRHLRERIEPRLNEQKDKRLPMNQVGNEERNLVALSSLVTCLHDISTMKRPVSPVLTHLAETQIKMQLLPGDDQQISVMLMYTSEAGKHTGTVTIMSLPSKDKPEYM